MKDECLNAYIPIPREPGNKTKPVRFFWEPVINKRSVIKIHHFNISVSNLHAPVFARIFQKFVCLLSLHALTA